jgi:predicted Fe-S protein YdhL (DUF1289 family)
MKERSCRVKTCTDGECHGCKRARRERGEARGKWVLEKLAEKGELTEVMTQARGVVAVSLADLMIDGDPEAGAALAALPRVPEMVEWF